MSIFDFEQKNVEKNLFQNPYRKECFKNRKKILKKTLLTFFSEKKALKTQKT